MTPKQNNSEITVLISEEMSILIIKLPHAIQWWWKKKGVDEIECKVFIKRSDSNLLSIRRELELRDGLCSEAKACRRSLRNLL